MIPRLKIVSAQRLGQRLFARPYTHNFGLRKHLRYTRPLSSITGSRCHSTAASLSDGVLPASFLRGGTSKGIFINRAHLPKDKAAWDAIFLRIMGSPDPVCGRQLDGMGGGISSLSKIVVVGTPSEELRDQGIDVEYTFVQVGVRDAVVDYSGNCGNLSSMVGVFAVDEGICMPEEKDDGMRAGVRSFNMNTRKVIDTSFPVDEQVSPLLDIPEALMAGVPGKASRIAMDFVNPAGAGTGRLLPTGSVVDTIQLSTDHSVLVSLVDATNPCVFVPFGQLPHGVLQGSGSIGSPSQSTVTPEGYQILEEIRVLAAEKMGIIPPSQAQPKIAIVGKPDPEDNDADITAIALSMGVQHKAIPMTVGLCLGVAAHLRHSVVQECLADTDVLSRAIRLRHAGGIVEVGAKFNQDGHVLSANVVRTGRRLMKGHVWC